MSWVDDTVHAVRRRHVARLINTNARAAFRRPWDELTEAERHAVMIDLAEREMLGQGVDLGDVCFRCRLCETHTVRYVEWAPLQCHACKNVFTWAAVDPAEVVIDA